MVGGGVVVGVICVYRKCRRTKERDYNMVCLGCHVIVMYDALYAHVVYVRAPGGG